MSAVTDPRRAALVAALLGAAVILALQALPAWLPALEYRRELLAAQPWRLLTAHLVHLNWAHALVNAAAWLLLATLFRHAFDARRQLLALALGALAVSLGMALLYPSISWYRGASGALHALFFASVIVHGAAAMRGRAVPATLAAAVLLIGGWIKVALELPPGAQTPESEWLAAPVVPQAHLLGALAGCVLGLAFAAASRLSCGRRS